MRRGPENQGGIERRQVPRQEPQTVQRPRLIYRDGRVVGQQDSAGERGARQLEPPTRYVDDQARYMEARQQRRALEPREDYDRPLPDRYVDRRDVYYDDAPQRGAARYVDDGGDEHEYFVRRRVGTLSGYRRFLTNPREPITLRAWPYAAAALGAVGLPVEVALEFVLGVDAVEDIGFGAVAMLAARSMWKGAQRNRTIEVPVTFD
jgi:hypothetical protein